MNLAVLTSSRADYGIYLPLLQKIKDDSFFNLYLIVFGTHLSPKHGLTVTQILHDGFDVNFEIDTVLPSDTERGVSNSIGNTIIKFSEFWEEHRSKFDLVLCLGDRYEMFAAVISAIPFNINFGHLHGGETTLGAIDNIFRHSITQSSTIHFTATEAYAMRVSEITGSTHNVFDVGALSLDSIEKMEFFTVEEFRLKWGIDISKPTILSTFHPETVSPKDNVKHARELVRIFKYLSNSYQIVVTLPNNDTTGDSVREVFLQELTGWGNLYLIENFGKKGYFTMMRYCSFLLGNTSSGIIEAASFGKYVIDLGSRQLGRVTSSNVIHSSIVFEAIIQAVNTIPDGKLFSGRNLYYKENPAGRIISILKETSANEN